MNRGSTRRKNYRYVYYYCIIEFYTHGFNKIIIIHKNDFAMEQHFGRQGNMFSDNHELLEGLEGVLCSHMLCSYSEVLLVVVAANLSSRILMKLCNTHKALIIAIAEGMRQCIGLASS